MTTWFVLTVFGKVVMTVGPLPPATCIAMLQAYQPPVLEEMIIADGRVLRPEDYAPSCQSGTAPPALGVFDMGELT